MTNHPSHISKVLKDEYATRLLQNTVIIASLSEQWLGFERNGRSSDKVGCLVVVGRLNLKWVKMSQTWFSRKFDLAHTDAFSRLEDIISDPFLQFQFLLSSRGAPPPSNVKGDFQMILPKMTVEHLLGILLCLVFATLMKMFPCLDTSPLGSGSWKIYVPCWIQYSEMIPPGFYLFKHTWCCLPF